MIKLETVQQLNRICFTICIVCIVLGAVFLFALIWMPQLSETVMKGFLSILVLFLTSLLAVGVIRVFVGMPSTVHGLPTPETHVMCPNCGQLVPRESDRCRHCHCKLIPQ